jgi:hypothetical protein
VARPLPRFSKLLRWFADVLLVVLEFFLPYSRFRVKDCTDNLRIGSRAPDFSLEAANRDGKFSLAGFLERGPVILEFLRGTW